MINAITAARVRIETMDQILAQLNYYWIGFVKLVPNLILALIELLVGILLAKLVSRTIRRGMERSKVDQQATLLVTQVVYYSILAIAVVTALSQIGVNVTALVAGLGIAGFTIGFAMQDVSKNFIAGILLLIQKPFRVGDTIEVTGYIGKVTLIDIRATEMVTLDGRIVIIPSAEVYTNAIVNFSRADRRRVEFQIGISYQNDLEQAQEVALRTLASLVGALSEPPPQANFQAFGNISVQLLLSFWADPKQSDLLAIKDQAVKAVQLAFVQAGVEIPSQSASIDQTPD
jgi:small conductance mechanosensitive channel